MDRPIRILEFSSANGEGGGPDKTILLGAARTDPKRFEVTVCYLRDAHDESFGIQDRASELDVDFVAVEERRRFDPAAWRKVRSLVRDRQIDIVHAHGYKADLFTSMLARKEDVIPLSTAHGFTGYSWRERYLYYPVDRRILGRFPLVIAVSSELRDTLVRAGVRSDRVRTVLNGIDHRRFRRDPGRIEEYRSVLGLGSGEIAIGGVGRIELQKRFDILLETFARLLARRPELRLFIAGEGSLRAKLELLARQLGLAHACRFLGDHRDIARIYQALDVFVQSADYEGTPNVVLEAMAFETPIVATDVGGTSELIKDNVHGLIVPPRNPGMLAEAVERVLDHPGEANERVAAARARIDHELSFDTRMQAVEQIYEELMSARQG